MDSEQIVRNAYQVAEDVDIEGWLAAFTGEGTFTDETIGVTYGGRDRAIPVQNYARAFPDMHRELYQVYVTGDLVIVQLALQGTHNGPLSVGDATLEPTGNRMDAPCCDVFELVDGKIERFDCYPSGAVIFAQLGGLGALNAAVRPGS